MTVRLRIGNSLNGTMSAKGTIKHFRAGSRQPSTYSYKTLPLEKINPSYTGSKSITVNEVKRYFDRDDGHEPRMSTGATMFVGLRIADANKWYSRPEDENMVGDFSSAMRTYGQSNLADESIGLYIKLYRLISGHSYKTTQAYFDNAIFNVSNVLWEFSPDGGDGKWYQLYDLPNRAYTRVTLPKQTTRLRVRALSNSLEEWVQSFAITPKPDYQKIGNEGGALENLTGAAIDRYGYLTWDVVKGGRGNIYYDIVQVDESGAVEKTIATVRESYYQLPSVEEGDRFQIIAVDEVLDRSYSVIITYSTGLPNYHYLNYELFAKAGYAYFDKSTGTMTLTGPGLSYTFGPRFNVTERYSELELDKFDIISYTSSNEQVELYATFRQDSYEGETDATWSNDTVLTSAGDDSTADTFLFSDATYANGTLTVGNSYLGHQINLLHIYDPKDGPEED